MKCDRCGTEAFLPFKCQYCGGSFCTEHRLPESHGCPRIEFVRQPREEGPQVQTLNVGSHEHTVTYPHFERIRGRRRFSAKEVGHLGVAALLVVVVGLSIMSPFPFLGLGRNYVFVGLSTLVFTFSFFIHEIAHKVTAQRNGLWAEFRLTLLGALLTLVSAISPLFKIISPGAVMIAGYADKEKVGQISVAGPATNLILSISFLAATLLSLVGVEVFVLGAYFNSMISLVNLIPYGVFDGSKVVSWSKRVWILCFGAASTLALLSLYQYYTYF